MPFRSLQGRVFAAVAGVLLCFLCLSLLNFSIAQERHFDREVARALESGHESFRQLMALRQELLRGKARSAAQTSFLRATLAIEGVDRQTLSQAASQMARIAEVPLVMLAASDGNVVFSDLTNLTQGNAGALLAQTLTGEGQGGVWCASDLCYLTFASPVIVAGQVYGAVAVAVPVDQALAFDLQKATGLDVAFFRTAELAAIGTSPATPLAATSLPVMVATESSQRRFGTAGATHWEEAGDALVLRVSLGGDTVTAVLHQSVDTFDRLYADALSGLVAITIVAGLVGLLVTKGLTQRILQPLSAVTEAVARMTRGQLDIRMQEEDRGEIGKLAKDFNQMAEEI